MLSDNSEKSRNPLKKAMRRRNAKTVQFAAPTYVEASDYDYSTEDEDHPIVEPPTSAVQLETAQPNGEHTEEELNAEPRSSNESTRASTPTRASFDREQAATIAASIAASTEEPQLSPKLVDKTEAAPLKSRKGTPRNTDSFLKDDSIETRKISLTPGLLKEDGSAKAASSESTRNSSMESLVKSTSPPEQITKKDSKKEKKEKKGGMLSGLFRGKKKDKRSKEDMGEQSDAEKPSAEYARDSPRNSPLPSGRSSPSVQSPTPMSGAGAEGRRLEVQSRQPSQRGKLQKQPPSNSNSGATSPVRELVQSPERPKEQVAELQGSEAAVEMAAADPEPDASADLQRRIDIEAAQQLPKEKEKESPLSPLTNILKRDDSKSQKPTKAKRSKQRVQLDDFDSPADEEGPNPFKEQEERERQVAPPAPASSGTSGDRLSESPVEITSATFMHGTESIHIPTPGPGDDSEDEEEDLEEPGSLTSSPSIIEHPAEPLEPHDAAHEDNDPTPTAPRSPQPASNAKSPPPARGVSADSSTSTSSTSLPLQGQTQTQQTPQHHLSPRQPSSAAGSWSDTSLRAWLEDGTDVKDMMVLIHDTSNVRPVGPEHPIMAGLGFAEQRKGVDEMMGRLDGLLGDLLGRRGIAMG